MSTEHRVGIRAARPLPPVPAEFEAIGAPLARGASAVVWRARNRVTGREVALKVWHSPLLTEQERGHFEAESRRHLELPDHPHIVRWLWAAAPADGPPWLATELHGESLGTILRRQGPYPLAAGLVIALDLLDGLAVMHQHGMVHRDVKPDNVVVAAGRAALCDLGISMSVTAPADDPAAGTRPYLAPELADDGGAVADFRSDVYSAARTIRQALGADIPQAVDAVLTRAQSAAPADRPADAGEFAARLAKVTAELGLRAGGDSAAATAGGAGAGGRSTHRPSRRTAMIGLITTVVLLIGAVVAVVALRTDPPSAAPAAASTPPAPPTAASAAAGASGASGRAGGPVAAATAAPDVDAAGRPVLLARRPDSGRCKGSAVPGGSVDHRAGGVTVATTTLYRDLSAGTLCAYFRKAGSDPTYDKPTYLALTLCNSAGQCDSDWYTYKWWAGPVAVSDTGGCSSWRVSMTDLAGTRWIVRDSAGTVGC